MSVHLFKAAGKPVVAGLTWRPLAGAEGRARKTEIKDAAQLLQSKFGVLYETESGNAAIGFVPNSAPKSARSAYSAAAWLASTVDEEEALLYLERLSNGQFWIVMVRNQFIDPRTDVIIEELEAVSLLDGMLVEHMGQTNLRVAVTGGTAPGSSMLDRQEIRQATFADLVKGKPARSNFRAKQLSGITPFTVIALAAIVVLAIAGYGVSLWVKKIKEQQAFEEMQQRALEQQLITERLENMTQLRIAEAVQNQIRNDTATPVPSQVIRACINQVGRAGLSIGGWTVTRVTCDVNSGAASVALTHRGPASGDLGTNASLMQAAERRGWTASLPALQGVTATVSLPPVDKPQIRMPLKVSELPVSEQYRRNFATTFQLAAFADRRLQANVAEFADRGIVYVDPAMDTSQDPTRFKPVPAERSYRKGTFTVSGSNLWAIDAIEFDQPYLSLDAVEVTVSAGTYLWRMNGAYYVSNI